MDAILSWSLYVWLSSDLWNRNIQINLKASLWWQKTRVSTKALESSGPGILRHTPGVGIRASNFASRSFSVLSVQWGSQQSSFHGTVVNIWNLMYAQ